MTPSPASSPVADLIQGIQGDLKLNISGTLPGEAVLTALISFLTVSRETMDPEVRKRFDLVLAQQTEDLQKLWRGLWVMLGVLK